MNEQRYFLNPESVSKHLFCSICQDVYNEPQRAPCGHSFCKECIFRWLSQSKTCPEDRRTVTKKDLHYDFILANIIGDQMVACPFRSRGCVHVGKLELLATHRRNCTFNPINLPDFMKEDAKNSTLNSAGNCSNMNSDSDDDDDKLPTPAKPSLKMRLFCDENKRELLRSVFEKNSPKDSTSASSFSSNRNQWLGKKPKGSKENKRPRVITIDDSF
ncbi:uncharacterized protein [Clytia hemisphaerica]|uniref:RING-type domain-containing protein n=1 Tax=Clytia hemisphaerica TaxID=252671 RepID=A0A7M5X2H3_9CNID